jgi:hypothetical protein
MHERPPTWQLVLDAAQQFTDLGESPFALGALIEQVQLADGSRDRTSIQPIVQGMTVNAGAGPPQPCGRVLERVSRGYYVLRATAAPIAFPRRQVRHVQRRSRLLTVAEAKSRLDGLIAQFDSWVDL